MIGLEADKNKNMMNDEALAQKWRHLQEILHAMGSVAVAFSGGVDSALLLTAARQALGDNALAVLAVSCLFPKSETVEAEEFCRKENIRLLCCPVDPMTISGFSENPKNRCYLCKRKLMQTVRKAAEQAGIRTVAEGSNLDDLGDYRPGRKALEELGIRSPLLEAGLTKAEIRVLSKQLSLPTWEKPSMACLASRLPYGERITEEKLQIVEQAEQTLWELGFRQGRVRMHSAGSLQCQEQVREARIEVLPEEFEKLMQKENRRRLVQMLKSLGFTYVTLDLEGFRSGSLNAAIGEEDRKG